MSLRDMILSSADLVSEPVWVPEWACTVHVKVMSGHERNAWNASAFDADGKLITENLRSRLLVHCLADSEGQSIFTAHDAAALEGKNSAVLDKLFTVAKRLNGLGEQAVESAAKK